MGSKWPMRLKQTRQITFITSTAHRCKGGIAYAKYCSYLLRQVVDDGIAGVGKVRGHDIHPTQRVGAG